MTQLTDHNFQDAFTKVNNEGFASLNIANDILPRLGKELYLKMDQVDFHSKRSTYYNEIAFYWPEDWRDVENGLGSFHEQRSLKNILPHSEATILLQKYFGDELSTEILNFVKRIKKMTIANHSGLTNNELRLSRVMLRQMNENDRTTHGGSGLHEDRGYPNRLYQQLLSVIITTYGKPTEALKCTPQVGELLLFNALDRRKLLGLGDEMAFIHKGPESGPKMFFLFEFLGPRA